jgi:micrococcal nuclease
MASRLAFVSLFLVAATGCGQGSQASPAETPFVNALSVEYPGDGAVVCNRSGTVTVRGHAPPGSSVSVDIQYFPDDQTPVDASGAWTWTDVTDQDIEHYDLNFHLAGDDTRKASIAFEFRLIDADVWDECTTVENSTVSNYPPPATVVPMRTPVMTNPPLGTAPIGRTEEAVVIRVIDGDTIVVDRGFGEEKVRYIGIDAPETVDPESPVGWLGPESSAANRALVEGQTVLLERDVSDKDAFGRLLRYVWIADQAHPGHWLLVNLVLVSEGFAQIATYPPDVRYADLYLDAQSDASTDAVGLWGTPPTPKPTPKPTKKPSNCHPSYVGACLKQGIGDYDCASGSGNGPNYVYEAVEVVGYDEFDLDRDGDGLGCELN